MGLIIWIGALVIPWLMVIVANRYRTCKLAFAWIGFISIWIAGSIAAVGIYEIVRDQTVFMTNIHAVFLNPLFLGSGAYVGMYVLYLSIRPLIENKMSS
ncbi:transposase [Paenibacillus sp. N1-5-1-14]|uniref:transposase n=1 Tax=Paenibacillus radicibacter TaxID=2972488 RepID=UPI002159308B|nr:transposase [Paenibacillus radicibacter]MCR8645204.1 transposase [Paenibacillus radicibacter]